MAINFEAANMAGYNNPRIEVFKARVNPETSALVSYPSKSGIIKCLNRGSLPVLVLTAAGTDAGYVLSLHSWSASEAGTSIIFCDASAIVGEHAVMYSPNSDTPVYQSGM